jgi:hypothetical protein
MKKNMGTIDKVLRLAGAVVLVVLFLANVVTGVLGYICLAIAAMFVITSVISFCPLYVPFKISTREKK